MRLEAFQQALVADPSDGLTWRAMADWLEEGGDDARAELVRVWLRCREAGGDERRLRELVAGGAVLPVPAVTNGVGMRFVLVPSPRPCWLATTPTTQAAYRAVMGRNPSRSARHPDHPVEWLTWEEMDEFCAVLGELRDEIRVGRRYRLPTVAEWQHAAGGPNVLGLDGLNGDSPETCSDGAGSVVTVGVNRRFRVVIEWRP